MGVPQIRFGHSLNHSDGANNGPPREYLAGPDGQPGAAGVDDDLLNGVDDIGEYGFPGTDDEYIGRFTSQETAHSTFNYPGDVPGTDPHVDTTLTLGADGSVNQFSNESFRRGEDILLNNVHDFDVKVWDDGLPTPAFVDLGNGGGAGFYQTTANPVYGNRYDTWHPTPLMPPPPYRPTVAAVAVPLRAIQITIRFLDVSSNRMRQVTLVYSLVN